MQRQSLLLEVLVSRRIARSGPTYLYRQPTGPKSPDKESIDRFLHKSAQEFDFGPILNGDQVQARQVALDYFQHLKDAARRENISFDDVVDRLKQISPHMNRSLNTFFTYFDSKVKLA